MIQFYAPGLPDDALLGAEESGHCIRVLRHKQGDTIICFDGRGTRYRCSILDANPKRVELQVLDTEDVRLYWHRNITLAVAPTKNTDRMEWLVEKAVEVGLDRIVLLQCEHSERKHLNTNRLERIIVSAAKQSLKATVPVLTEMVPFRTFIDETASAQGQKYFGYCDDKTERRLLSQCLIDAYKTYTDLPVTVMIGPEGDFSPQEVRWAIDAGFLPVSFGEFRLRTETAALFALQTIHIADQLCSCN